jgi:hypothetical protein
MSKTTYVDGNPAEGVPGTIVTADFLNKVNNHYHTGRDIDGEGALAYAADTGEADAYVLTLSPALDAYIPGMPVCFKAGNANTGASTIDINGLGVKAMKKNGNEDLVVGDILAGQIVTVIYDGTNFQLMAAPRVLALRDAARGLVVKNNTSNPNHQVDISADEIILQDASGNPMRVLNLSMTADITVSGAGGLDAGSEAASTWYHLWVIARADGTTSVIFSTSATAPTLPAGYTYKAYAGLVQRRGRAFQEGLSNWPPGYDDRNDSRYVRRYGNELHGCCGQCPCNSTDMAWLPWSDGKFGHGVDLVSER